MVLNCLNFRATSDFLCSGKIHINLLKVSTHVRKYKKPHDDSTEAGPHTSRNTNSKGDL
jgi:hypothetical protein